MIAHIRPCIILFALLTLLTGIVYPAMVTGVAQLLFHEQANGSVLMRDGRAIGSHLIGQSFDDGKYFWGRPSATGPMPYNSASSSGSNLGPTNPALLEAIESRVKAIRTAHPDQTSSIPIDLVTASASGLDPHISPAAAKFQVSRVAKERGLSDDKVREIVARHTEGRTFGLLGEPRVNVLQLNLSLDAEVVR